MDAQVMFKRYNRRYWKGRLPHYAVLVTDKYSSGLCKKQQRTIYINPATPGGISLTLLHEMAHAAVKGNEHGKAWMKEIRRLVRLGAPLKTELSHYAQKKVCDTNQILGDFHGAGFEAEKGVLGSKLAFVSATNMVSWILKDAPQTEIAPGSS